jgi:hypothetical protein
MKCFILEFTQINQKKFLRIRSETTSGKYNESKRRNLIEYKKIQQQLMKKENSGPLVISTGLRKYKR